MMLICIKQHLTQETFLVFQDVLKTYRRLLQHNNFWSSKTSSRCAYKMSSWRRFANTSSIRLGRQNMLRWKGLQDVSRCWQHLKFNSCESQATVRLSWKKAFLIKKHVFRWYLLRSHLAVGVKAHLIHFFKWLQQESNPQSLSL